MGFEVDAVAFAKSRPKRVTCSARNNGSSTQMHFTNLSRRQAAWVMSWLTIMVAWFHGLDRQAVVSDLRRSCFTGLLVAFVVDCCFSYHVDCVDHPCQCTLVTGISTPNGSHATLGYDALHRRTPEGSVSCTLLDPGDNSFACCLI